ncbi:MAG: PadR family transcriptional regulator [Lachnospiraceae bacterium]|nr:PadR family transcriptional regulator [Lachnospiraceae bacterium]
MAYTSNLISGTLDLLVLSLLKQKDTYAYEISKDILNYSEGLLELSLNSIYTVLYKFEKENMVTEYSILVGRKRTRIYYHLEPLGEEYLDALSKDYFRISEGVNKVLHSAANPENETI